MKAFLIIYSLIIIFLFLANTPEQEKEICSCPICSSNYQENQQLEMMVDNYEDSIMSVKPALKK